MIIGPNFKSLEEGNQTHFQDTLKMRFLNIFLLKFCAAVNFVLMCEPNFIAAIIPAFELENAKLKQIRWHFRHTFKHFSFWFLNFFWDFIWKYLRFELSLRDRGCPGEFVSNSFGTFLAFNISEDFTKCGTEIESNETHISYQNRISDNDQTATRHRF